ncbi:MAG: phosphoribosylglycinamide formyltransferase [Deltaproteobacteria bacterium]|nr:phosphoribosylglycinamide formyltransferase [Deltaproteobacteria bacterium]
MVARLAVLISGRGSNMAAILESCRSGVLEGTAEVAIVLSNIEGAAGIELARTAGVETRVVVSKGRPREDFEVELTSVLVSRRIDVVVLAGFMRVLTPTFVSVFRGRIVNIHPADTRVYQGAHGYEWAFENRLGSTWITVHEVDEGVDTGRVLGRAAVDLSGAATLEEVKRRGLAVEHRLYPEVLRTFLLGLSAVGVEES